MVKQCVAMEMRGIISKAKDWLRLDATSEVYLEGGLIIGLLYSLSQTVN